MHYKNLTNNIEFINFTIRIYAKYDHILYLVSITHCCVFRPANWCLAAYPFAGLNTQHHIMQSLVTYLVFNFFLFLLSGEASISH